MDLTYRISGEILVILITGLSVFSVSVFDFDFRTGAELDRRSVDEGLLVVVVFFFSAGVIGGFLIVETIFFEVFLILLFETVPVSDESDSELPNDGLITIGFRREAFG